MLELQLMADLFNNPAYRDRPEVRSEKSDMMLKFQIYAFLNINKNTINFRTRVKPSWHVCKNLVMLDIFCGAT